MNRYFTVYESPITDCETPYKINLMCTMCGKRVGSYLTSKMPKFDYELLDSLRKIKASFDINKSGLEVYCYDCKVKK